jgi:hypothetical protein
VRPLLPTRALALLVASLVTLGGTGGCSFVVESEDHQCESDEDCKGFDDAVCNVSAGVCVRREAATTSSSTTTSAETSTSASSTTSTGTGEECVGEDGCFACDPVEQADWLNACTDAACVPFDNGRIADLLEEDGSLPPVP